ncbi:MAG: winged helix-turn-helix transcriptional regulator [Thaumarchaeota archaeon]|nr:winged helix-turn-helix transcriptional regulator [Nitrososphaerota archaeon]
MNPAQTSVDDSEAIQSIFTNKQRLRIYWYMLSKGDPAGVREIQRALGMSSPSVAHHHLEKLTEMGVVAQDEYGRYVLVKQVEVGILQGFSRIGRFMLPRFSFYAVFFSTLLGFYLVRYSDSLNIFAVLFSASAAAVSWYESIRAWTNRPF